MTAAETIAEAEWANGCVHREGDLYIAGIRTDPQGEKVTGVEASIRIEDLEETGTPGFAALGDADDLIWDNRHDEVIIAAWGGRDAQRTLEDFITARAQRDHHQHMPVATAVRIEHDQVFTNTSIQQGPEIGAWDWQGSTADVSEQMIPRGYKPPLASSSVYLESLAPSDTRAQAADNGALEQIYGIKPSLRAHQAIDTLEALVAENAAEVADPGYENPYRDGQIGLIAETVASHYAVRDAVALYASESHAHRASLIDAYRHAPEPTMPSMSACAGLAGSLGGGSTHATEIISLEASQHPEHSDAAGFAARIAVNGIDPTSIRTRLLGQSDQHLASADTEFVRELDAQRMNQIAAMNSPWLGPEEPASSRSVG